MKPFGAVFQVYGDIASLGAGVCLVKMLKLHMGFQSTDPFECVKIEETDIIDNGKGQRLLFGKTRGFDANIIMRGCAPLVLPCCV